MNWSRKLFALILRLYPRRFREQHGADMWSTFQNHLNDARARGRLAVFRLWIREVLAILQDMSRKRSANRRLQRRRFRSDVGNNNLLRDVSLLDFKLGVRMLLKYPGLTLVGGLGIAVAIAIGVGFYGFLDSFAYSTLPFEDGDRVVTIQTWNIEQNRQHPHDPRDITAWRELSTSVDDIGAVVRVPGRNLTTHDGRVELVRQAVISASAFRMTRVQPFLGRALVESDETGDAVPAVVLGYDLWREVFDASPDVLGNMVRVGDRSYSIVGVMPDGFAFPLNEEIWTPLRLNSSTRDDANTRPIIVFGRLAPEATIEEARAEFSTIGVGSPALGAETGLSLRPRVLPYTEPFVDMDSPGAYWTIRVVRLLVTLVLVVICLNVAILVYARTAMRHREIGVRTALGATRRRVVTQLFVEAFVLSSSAAVVGVMIAAIALRKIDAWWQANVGAQLVWFWMEFELSAGSIVYAFGLTVLAGVLVGVLPGLRATGRDIQPGLQRLGSGSTLGGTWTFLIVSQVAVAVAALPLAAYWAWSSVKSWNTDPGFNADEYVTARVVVEPDQLRDPDPEPLQAESGNTQSELAEFLTRLESSSIVNTVTYGRYEPGVGGASRVNVVGWDTGTDSDPESRQGHFVYSNGVGPAYFDSFGLSILSGRNFMPGDFGTNTNAVIVNQRFATRIMGGENPIGSRITYQSRSDGSSRIASDTQYEIVGIVRDFAPNPNFSSGSAAVYHPAAPSELDLVNVTIHMRGTDAASAAALLRQAASAVDPTMQLYGIHSEGHEYRQERRAFLAIAFAISILMLCVILLSAAGIYALMSFTVVQRRREIGIRIALGGRHRHILGDIFLRAVFQLSAGVLVGIGVAAIGEVASGGQLFEGNAPIVLAMGATMMFIVGFVAALGPARRGLKVQPTEALQGAD